MADSRKKLDQEESSEDRAMSEEDDSSGTEEFYSEISRGQSAQDQSQKKNQDEYESSDSGMDQSDQA